MVKFNMCNPSMYNFKMWIKYIDEQELIVLFDSLLNDAGFTVIDKVEHFFDIQGYTGLWLLAESHFAIHTFPEAGKVYIELSSCVKKYFDEFMRLINGVDIIQKIVD